MLSHVHQALDSGSLSERLENLRGLGFRGPKPRKTCWAGSVFLGCVIGKIQNWMFSTLRNWEHPKNVFQHQNGGSPLTHDTCFFFWIAQTPYSIEVFLPIRIRISVAWRLPAKLKDLPFVMTCSDQAWKQGAESRLSFYDCGCQIFISNVQVIYLEHS